MKSIMPMADESTSLAAANADGAPREDVEEGGRREYEPTQGCVHKRRRVQHETQLLFRD
jgi:hypothetical protein